MRAASTPTGALLEVRDLAVSYRTRDGRSIPVVLSASLSVRPGEIVAVVGESGCGKSTVLSAILRLIGRDQGTITGRVAFEGQNLLELSDRQMRRYRGRRIGTIFQDPTSALNPVMTMGKQVDEALRLHTDLDARARRARALELLELVHLADPEHVLRSYPHQVSGGMRQRVMIAIAISCGARLLLADEPTTALDATTEYQIVKLLRELRATQDVGIVFVTHDLALASGLADRTLVMYSGRIVEDGPTSSVFAHPAHPYTQGLLGASPSLTMRRDAELTPIPGEVALATTEIGGCQFHPRCGQARPGCAVDLPVLEDVSTGQRAACWVVSERTAAERGQA